MKTASSITQVFLIFPTPHGWSLLVAPSVGPEEPGGPGGGERVTTLIFRELSPAFVPGAPQVRVWW